jgi:hypothetical protein
LRAARKAEASFATVMVLRVRLEKKVTVRAETSQPRADWILQA